MVVVGMWLAIVGYGIAYSGMVQLGGGQCSIIDAFRGRCAVRLAGELGASTASTASAQGQTVRTQLLAQQSQQAGMIGSTPIPQVA